MQVIDVLHPGRPNVSKVYRSWFWISVFSVSELLHELLIWGFICCVHVYIYCSEGGAEGEAVQNVWGEGPKCHFCFQVPYSFWRWEIYRVWFDLWFCGEREEVWAKIQAYQGKFVIFLFIRRISMFQFLRLILCYNAIMGSKQVLPLNLWILGSCHYCRGVRERKMKIKCYGKWQYSSRS